MVNLYHGVTFSNFLCPHLGSAVVNDTFSVIAEVETEGGKRQQGDKQ